MMAYPHTTATIMRSVSSEQREYIADSGSCMLEAPLNGQLGRTSSDGPVAILWDIENCPVPSDVRPEDIGGNIRMALRVYPVIRGAVTMFSAYGDFNTFPKRLREGCQRTGVKLIDVPSGRKDAADKAILVDMFLFALDNPPPSTIMLISGDVDFAQALHVLSQRGYTVILVTPQRVVSSALLNAGKFVWDWPSVAHGEGFVPLPRSSTSVIPWAGPSEVNGHLMGCNFSTEDFQSYYNNSRDFPITSHSVTSLMPCYSPTTRSHTIPACTNEYSVGVTTCGSNQNGSTSWVHPGDLNGLKRQVTMLLENAGGGMPMIRVPAEYHKQFGRPLFVSEYGESKLVELLNKMGDVILVAGKGKKRFVYLLNQKMCPTAPPFMKAKGNVSSDEVSDEDRGGVVIDELEQFKYELQEILVSYYLPVFLGGFEEKYEQRYKKPLEYHRFGVDRLEDLFEKVRDVVVLHEEPRSGMKFLTAVGG